MPQSIFHLLCSGPGEYDRCLPACKRRSGDPFCFRRRARTIASTSPPRPLSDRTPNPRTFPATSSPTWTFRSIHRRIDSIPSGGITGITFIPPSPPPGQVALTDMHFSYYGTVELIDLVGLKLTPRTPYPPGSVTEVNSSTFTFPVTESRAPD